MSQEIKYGAVDDGFFDTKVYTGLGNKFSIPSRVRIGAASTFSFMGDGNTAEYITEQGSIYSVGGTESENIANDAYHGSVFNRVMVNHSLICAGMGGETIKLATGLPLRNYYVGEAFEKNEALIDKKVKNLSQSIALRKKNGAEFTADVSVMPNIMSNVVIPQGLAAWYDYIIKEDATNPNVANSDPQLIEHEVAIIDIGGRTTDIAVVLGRNGLDKKACVSPKCGVHDIYDNLRDALSNRIPPEVLTLKKLDQCMKTKTIFYSGEHLDITNEINESTNMVVEKLRSIINSAIGEKGKAIENILFVGGGSEALYPYLKDIYKHQILVEDAAFANAKGMYKAMRFVMKV